MAELSTFDFDVKQKNIMTSAADGKVCPDNQCYRNELGGLEPRRRWAIGSAHFG